MSRVPAPSCLTRPRRTAAVEQSALLERARQVGRPFGRESEPKGARGLGRDAARRQIVARHRAVGRLPQNMDEKISGRLIRAQRGVAFSGARTRFAAALG